MSDYLLQMNGIVKSFGGVKALNGIDITVKPGECVGLCGENGAGKSTLMKVLSAVYPYGTWEGEILWDGQPLKAQSISETEAAGIVIIHQELTLVPDLSVAENIFMGHELTLPGGRMNYPAMIHRAESLMRELKVPDMNVALPVSQYGGGYQQLVEIAKALNKKARLLILDEPSSALTRSEIEVLLDIIRDLKAKGSHAFTSRTSSMKWPPCAIPSQSSATANILQPPQWRTWTLRRSSPRWSDAK